MVDVKPSLPPLHSEVVPGLSREWDEHERILILTFFLVSNTIADAWANEIRSTFTKLTTSQPIHYLHDASRARISAFTPEIRRKVEETMRGLSHYPGKTAIILDQPIVAELINVFLRLQRQGNRQRRTFQSREQALIWIRAS